MQDYTQEQATIDIAASIDSIKTCETIQAISEADRTEDQVGELFRSEGHLRLKMNLPLFVSSLSSDQASRIASLSL